MHRCAKRVKPCVEGICLALRHRLSQPNSDNTLQRHCSTRAPTSISQVKRLTHDQPEERRHLPRRVRLRQGSNPAFSFCCSFSQSATGANHPLILHINRHIPFYPLKFPCILFDSDCQSWPVMADEEALEASAAGPGCGNRRGESII